VELLKYLWQSTVYMLTTLTVARTFVSDKGHEKGK
jgi:hypothetical protein